MSLWSTIKSIPLIGDVVKVAASAAKDTTARLNATNVKNMSENDRLKATISLAQAVEGKTAVDSKGNYIEKVASTTMQKASEAILKLKNGDDSLYNTLLAQIPGSNVVPDATQSVYTSQSSVISDIAKAIGLNVNLDANGKVTGSLSAGTAANPTANALESITAAISKYWWILVIVLGAVLIFRRGRR